MGNKQSSKSVDLPQSNSNGNGQPQIRAIAKGRLYVILHYPKEVDEREGTEFNDDSFRQLLAELQKNMPDFEVTLDAGKVDRFSEHALFFNSSDPEKDVFKPRVLVEVFYTGMWGGLSKDMIKQAVVNTLDPSEQCHFDIRSEMGRYHTTSHLETLLRI